MPFIEINGNRLYYEDSGNGPETIVFCHGLICNCRMFDAQVEAFKDNYRCVTFDFRGHGKSGLARNGSDMEALSDDVVRLIQVLNCEPCHLLGFSMGGFAALRLAINHSSFLRSLILVGTTSDPMPKEEIFQFQMLGFMARWIGFWSIVNQVMPMMFSESFLNDPEKLELKNKWRNHILSNPKTGAAHAVKGVIGRKGVYDQLDKISLETLIIVGDKDKLAAPENSIRIHKKLQNSTIVTVPDAGHMVPVERPEAVNSAIREFIQ